MTEIIRGDILLGDMCYFFLKKVQSVVGGGFRSFGGTIFPEVATKKLMLKNVTNYIVECAGLHYNYGIILITEGLIDFNPEMQNLIAELNEILAQEVVDGNGLWKKKLANQSLQPFELLPDAIQDQLMLQRDPYGNVQVAKIET